MTFHSEGEEEEMGFVRESSWEGASLARQNRLKIDHQASKQALNERERGRKKETERMKERKKERKKERERERGRKKEKERRKRERERRFKTMKVYA